LVPNRGSTATDDVTLEWTFDSAYRDGYAFETVYQCLATAPMKQ
jgi:hypothetical protein